MRYYTCILCDSDDAEPVITYKGFSMVECKHCRLVYQVPRPEQEELNKLYKTYHIRKGKGPENWWVMMRRIFVSTVSLITEYYPNGGSVLDIGCGYGHFLWIMKERGWTVQGIDPSPETVAYAHSRGLRVFEGNFEEFDASAESFDVITMFYVLEHLIEPVDALKKVWRLLKPDGMLVIRVPHTTPLVKLLKFLYIPNNLYDLPFHIYDYSPPTLRELLKKTGFSGVKIFVGKPTSPPSIFIKMFSLITGYTAHFLERITVGRILMPGVSKTAISFKKGK